ncbi:MAG TPA: hypothetical protein VFN92_11685 [Solirubrobacterales bacterium]|nr:hypothetical protein [Solirubrobacterales bacterium]
MAVMVPRENWTDKRLDDLNGKVDAGFARADEKMDKGFALLDGKIEGGLSRVDADIRELRGELSALQRGLFAATVVIVAATIGPSLL